MSKNIFLLTLISIGWLFGQENRGYIVNIADPSPNFFSKIDTLIKNTDPKFHNKNGKVIMLQFTASWCSVCIKEMPFIEEEIWQQHKENDNFILIALAKDTPKRPQRDKEIQFMIEKTKVTYPILTDYNSEIFELFAEKKAGVTRNIIIDQNGDIAFLTRLFEQSEFNAMKSTINQLLKKK